MADIQITDLTNGAIVRNTDGEFVWRGTGVFDKLIEAVDKNVKIEYDNGRITGTAYAEVYLGAMQSVIAQSMQYVLQEKLVEAQIEEMANRTLLVEAQIDELRSKISIAETQSAKDLLLKDKQIEKINDELLTTAKQRALIDKDIELKDIQESELQLNGVANRAVKEKDGIVKDKQADLYVRQKTALDDSLLKDLYKEAAGGTAMVYADASIDTPTHWSRLDTLADAIAHRVDPSLNLTS